MSRRREMRQHPIGTGPFKFVEFKPNESIKVVAQPGLLEAGPALSRRHRIHDHPEPRRPAILAFVAGKFDMTFPYDVTVPLLKDIKSQAPQAICERDADQRQPRPADQPRRSRRSTIRNCAGRWR